VIDVRSLAGTTDSKGWPASPEITPEHIRKFESSNGPLQPGEIVVFQTGQSERCVNAKGSGAPVCFLDPMNGKSEGWPSPGPSAIKYLARKQIRAVGIDAPTLGGVNERRALMTYWALGSEGMAGIEYLANLARLGQKSYLIFGAVKIRGAHGAPGRAIAFY
jgi:kynurenine formamidase